MRLLERNPPTAVVAGENEAFCGQVDRRRRSARSLHIRSCTRTAVVFRSVRAN